MAELRPDRGGQHRFDFRFGGQRASVRYPGVRAALGRTFLPGEFDSSAQQVVVISDRLWRKHFRADPKILGRQILLDGEGYIVVGVMGPEFVFTNPAQQAWIPYKPSTVVHGELHGFFSNMGRLRPGVSITSAQHEVDAVTPGLPANPDREKGWHARVQPFTEQFTGPYRRALEMLWGAVGLVLLIAGANAANLLLARASERRREFAIRASLGADRFRLARLVMGETLTLGLAAGAAGVVLAFGLIRLLVRLFAGKLPIPRLDEVSMNGMALGAAVGLVLLATLLCDSGLRQLVAIGSYGGHPGRGPQCIINSRGESHQGRSSQL